MGKYLIYMATRIRLSRHGRKKRPFYHIVVADVRAPRDGRYIEKLGTYNPINDPLIVDLNFDSALAWIQKGAEPSDTCRTILSNEGVMYKHHLIKGIKKGALTEEQVEERFNKWKAEKDEKLRNKKETIIEKENAEIKKRLTAETKIKDVRTQALVKKNSDLARTLGLLNKEEDKDKPEVKKQVNIKKKAEDVKTEETKKLQK